MNDKDIEEKLQMMFQRKLLEMWPPPISPEDAYDTAHRIKKWNDYIKSLGGRVLDWKGAIRGRLDNGVLFHNPSEHPYDFGKVGADPRYIFLPEETAMKILVLGYLP